MIELDLPIAERRAAQHCPQLLGRAVDLGDTAQAVTQLARRFAQEAARGLAELCDARGLRVECDEPQLVDCPAALATLGVHSVNSFLSLGAAHTGALISMATCEVNAQFERLLGGDGRVDRTSVHLAHSARSFASQLEQRILAALRDGAQREEFALAASLGKAADICPFDRDDTVWVFPFTIAPPVGSQWTLTMVLCRASLSQLVDARAASPAAIQAIGELALDRSAIGHIDLPLRAVLVDTSLSLSRLTQLQVGSILPIAINRSIPLVIGHAVVAHGTAGEIDDTIALEISTSSLPGIQ